MSQTKEIALRDRRIAAKGELEATLGPEYQVVLLGGGASKWLSIIPLAEDADLHTALLVADGLGIDIATAIFSGGAVLL